MNNPRTGYRECELGQEGYAKTLVERFKSDSGFSKLPKHTTPRLKNFTAKPDDNEKGKFSRSARRHVMGVLFLARGSRFELLEAVGVLSRCFETWTKRNDRELIVLMGYLSCTLNAIHVLTVVDDDFPNFKIFHHVDADHGGCLDTRKSTTGSIFTLSGQHGMHCALEAFSRLQRTAAPSTPHAEIAAIDESLRKIVLPLSLMVEFMFERINIL